MNRNLALGLGTIIGIFAMLLFLQANVDMWSFGRSFPLPELQLRKLSKEVDNRLRFEFETQKNFSGQPVVRDNPIGDKCL